MKGANQAFADSVFLAVKGYIDVVVARFIKQEIAPIERRLTELPPGRDGKDADADAIAEVVLGKVVKALEAVPPPKDGRDGKDADPEVTKAAVTAEVERVLATWPKPRDGVNGKSVDMVEMSAQIVEAAVKAVQALPPAPAGKDGKDGANGRDASPEQIEAAVAKAVAAIPKPADGAAGKDGRDGLDGKDGKDGIDGKEGPAGKNGIDGKSVSLDEVRALLADMVQKAVAQIPLPKDGKDGADADPEFIRAEVQRAVDLIPKPRDGRDGMKGERGEPGRDGIGERGNDGRDGRDADPELVRQEVEIAIAKMAKPERGEPGKDGKDGLSFDDFRLEAKDGGRIFAVTFSGGGREMTHEVRTAMPIYRGLYKSGASHQIGDEVTYGGGRWIALKDTSNPPTTRGEWRLMEKSHSGPARHWEDGGDSNAGDPS